MKRLAKEQPESPVKFLLEHFSQRRVPSFKMNERMELQFLREKVCKLEAELEPTIQVDYEPLTTDGCRSSDEDSDDELPIELLRPPLSARQDRKSRLSFSAEAYGA